MQYKIVKFFTLKIGDKFEIYGDEFFGYPYSKLCLCKKTKEDSAYSITAGMNFFIDKNQDVLVEELWEVEDK